MLGGEGLVGIIVVGISLLFVSKTECSIEIGLCDKGSMIDDVKTGFQFLILHYEYLLVMICNFVFIPLYNVFGVMMNYHYTPAHRVIPKTFKVLVWIIQFIPFFGDNAKESYHVIIGELLSYIFQMFGVLMFAEVIIVGICEVDKNIESEIIKREMEEFDTRKEGLIPNF